MPSASDAPHSASRNLSPIRTDGISARAAATSSGPNSGSPASFMEIGARSRWNASRSSSAGGGRSSSAMPSSSATTPNRVGVRSAMPSRSSTTSPESSVAPSRAAVEGSSRSAIAITSTPPSASTRMPRSATGRPTRSVAARSSPPSSRPSVMCSGSRRSGTASGSHCRRIASQRSRTGPAWARSDTPTTPAGSTANRAAARVASVQREISDLSALTRRTAPRRRARRAWSIPRHQADCAAAGAAGPAAPPAADGRR